MRTTLRWLPALLLPLALATFATAAEEHVDEHDVMLPKKAVALLIPTEGNQVRGTLTLTADGKKTRVSGKVTGLTPGLHGFHIHEFGDLTSSDGSAAGGHYNPGGHKHGGPEDKEKHAGDLGNIKANEDGVATVDVIAEVPLHFVVGRAFVVHAKADDLKSQPSGDAGGRVALGLIGIANAKPMAKK